MIMKKLSINRRTVALLLVLLPLLLGFGYVATRSGPLAPVPVTVEEVREQAVTPALFGIGTVEARYRYRIGPVMTGRLLRLEVDVGDRVRAGELLGEMDPVDMDDKIAANRAAVKRARASVVAAEAHVKDWTARAEYARIQMERYRRLAKERNVSREAADGKEQEYQVTQAGLAAARASLNAARRELDMLLAEHEGLLRQRSNLRLVAPTDGLVVGRHVEPGSTAMAGQTVLELVKPESIWINVRFSQLQSEGLAKGQTATIVLRSRSDHPFPGEIERVELLADPVTEETLAKVTFERLPEPIPPLGELAEVTVSLPRVDPAPVVPNASIKRLNGKRGVWLVVDDTLRFVPVEIGASDLEGRVQILRGIKPGDRVVVYSTKELTAHSRITIVDHLVDSRT